MIFDTKSIKIKEALLHSKMLRAIGDDIEAQNGLKNIYKKIDYIPHSPVKNMEKSLDIKGIHKEYKILDDGEQLDLEKLMKAPRVFDIYEKGWADSPEEKKTIEHIAHLKKENLSYVQDVYNQIIKNNPELKEIPIDKESFKHQFALIFGACSGFPVEDIKEFCEAVISPDPYYLANKNFEKKANAEKLQNYTCIDTSKVFAHWCPSQKTIAEIKAKLLEKADSKDYPLHYRTDQKVNNYHSDAEKSFIDYQNFLVRKGYYDD